MYFCSMEEIKTLKYNVENGKQVIKCNKQAKYDFGT